MNDAERSKLEDFCSVVLLGNWADAMFLAVKDEDSSAAETH